MVGYKGFAKDFDNTPKVWQYFAYAFSIGAVAVMLYFMVKTIFP